MPDKLATPKIIWPTNYVQVTVNQMPPDVKRWMRRNFNAELLSADEITLHLRMSHTTHDHRKRTENALRKQGLSDEQIQKIIRKLPA